METEQLVPVIIAFLVAATGWLKSHTEVKAVQRAREETKAERDTQIAMLSCVGWPLVSSGLFFFA